MSRCKFIVTGIRRKTRSGRAIDRRPARGVFPVSQRGFNAATAFARRHGGGAGAQIHLDCGDVFVVDGFKRSSAIFLMGCTKTKCTGGHKRGSVLRPGFVSTTRGAQYGGRVAAKQAYEHVLAGTKKRR